MKMQMTSVVAKVSKIKQQIAAELTRIEGVRLDGDYLIFAQEHAAQLAAAAKEIFVTAKKSRKYDRAHVAAELWRGFASAAGQQGFWRPAYHHGIRA